MIEELANLLEDFPGPANQTCCFTHVLDLVVKSILANDIELEEELSREDVEGGEDGEDRENDNYKGWVDEQEAITTTELEELDLLVQPVRLLLTKVRP